MFKLMRLDPSSETRPFEDIDLLKLKALQHFILNYKFKLKTKDGIEILEHFLELNLFSLETSETLFK